MKNKLTVTIGIPVYNEEANIANLLTSVLSQKEIDYKLKQLIIVCDASTDGTYLIVKSFKDKRILHLRNSIRQGQQFSQNEILKHSISDITVFLEGDIVLATNKTINNLVKPFVGKGSKPGMTIGIPKPVEASNFYEGILNYGQIFRSGLFELWKGGDNVYTAGGHSMKAISKEFVEKLTWPKQVPEDAFTYLSLKKLGFKMQRIPSAVAIMRNPATFADRTKQVTKFQSGKWALKKYFDSSTVDKEYKIPISLKVKYTLSHFIDHPILLTFYLIDMALNRILTIGKRKFNALYEPYYSSRKLK